MRAPRLHASRGARVFCGFATGVSSLVMLLMLGACGGGERSSEIAAPGVAQEEWPPLAVAPGDAVNVKGALASADGAQVRVRAYLVAVALPCPACAVGERTGPREQDRVGHTARPAGPTMPGCLPCPSPVATFSDEAPSASALPESMPLRAVGGAAGLQARHVGKMFLITGTFHPRGVTGPELDVTDVHALDVQRAQH